MRRTISTAIFGLVGLVGSTVVTMMWPTIDPALGASILAVCGLALVVALAILLPDAWAWLRSKGVRVGLIIAIGVWVAAGAGIGVAALLTRKPPAVAEGASARQPSDIEAVADRLGEAITKGQRPWVSLDIEVAGPLSHFDKPPPGRQEWHVPIVYRLQNTSSVPANGVAFFASIRPWMISVFKTVADGKPVGSPTVATDIANELEQVCNFHVLMAKNGHGRGQPLFPGEVKQQRFELNANPQFFKEAMGEPGYSGQLLITVCVVYGTDPKDLKYSTAKAYTLFREKGDIPLNDTVPADQLRLVPHPLNSGYAK